MALGDGREILERFQLAPRQHARLLLPMVNEVLTEAGVKLGELDALAFGRGPGSFTGLRIAAGVTQGLALGAGLPVVPVSDLAALAQGAARERDATQVLACLDARMGEVYWGAYRRGPGGLVTPMSEERVSVPEAVACPAPGDWHGAGQGFAAYPALRSAPGGRIVETEPERVPRAADVLRLALAEAVAGNTVAAEAAIPVYLRDEVAWKKGRVG